MTEVSYVNKIYNKFLENKLAHAFLIETNNVEQSLIDLLYLIKKINCIDEFLEDCDKCNLCNLIDNNILPSLKIIEAEGKNIKKEQILELKNNFKYKPIYSKYNIYIIKNAELLNDSSANTMLKFLEEPTENIIGFFITSSRDNVISTIKSRCQIYSSYYKEEAYQNSEAINKHVYNYIFNIEKSTAHGLLYNKEMMNSGDVDKSNLIEMFTIILKTYKNILDKLINCDENVGDYDFLIETNDIKKIVKKLKVVEATMAKLVYNVNVELFLDKFVIEMRNYDE